MAETRFMVMIASVCLVIRAQACTAEEPPATDTAEKELIASLVEANAQLAAANLATTQRIEALSKVIGEMRESLKTTLADRDDKLERVVLLTDELHKMHDLVKRLEERQKELVAQVARLEAEKGAALEKEFPVEDIVLLVKLHFAEISIGADDGVAVGDVFDVFRDRTYVGRIVVRKTDSDRAVAEEIADLKKQKIVKGDQLRRRPNVSIKTNE